VQGSGVQGSGSRVQVLGVGVQILGCRVQGSGLRVEGLRVEGLREGFRFFFSFFNLFVVEDEGLDAHGGLVWALREDVQEARHEVHLRLRTSVTAYLHQRCAPLRDSGDTPLPLEWGLRQVYLHPLALGSGSN